MRRVLFSSKVMDQLSVYRVVNVNDVVWIYLFCLTIGGEGLSGAFTKFNPYLNRTAR